MTRNELVVVEEYELLRSQIVTLDRSFRKETLIFSKMDIGAVEMLRRLEGMK
ncbi:hypothetical protein [Methanosarcina mazei]|uniref:hypothetical protein n=1 Tax=Methanosarcina mazei TaxID=2209 RepID=UPI000AF316EF|nr:hypothetical protein [Methanosarcina mazei]BBL65186.1 hypothetical protein MmazTMA_21630 [Methanosarcina mazei]